MSLENYDPILVCGSSERAYTPEEMTNLVRAIEATSGEKALVVSRDAVVFELAAEPPPVISLFLIYRKVPAKIPDFRRAFADALGDGNPVTLVIERDRVKLSAGRELARDLAIIEATEP